MKNVYSALLKAQREFPVLPKDAVNPAFRSRYSTLATVLDTVMPVLNKHGLVLSQSVRTDIPEHGGIIIYVGTALVHAESVETINFEIGLVPAKPDSQGIGSAITYGRRFGAMTICGIAPEDDDANAASNQRPPQQQAARQPQPQAQAAQHPQQNLHDLAASAMGETYSETDLSTWASDGRANLFADLEPGEVERLTAGLVKRMGGTKRKGAE